MGELELGLSELPALRPIRTAADIAGCCVVAPMTVDAGDDGGEFLEPQPRKDGVVVDDVAGCVTPTVRRDGAGEEDGGADVNDVGFVTPTVRRDGAGEEDGGADVNDVGFVTPTVRRDGGGEEDGGAGIGIGADVNDVGFVTPMSAASALGQPTVCPPAPRKLQGAAKRKSWCGRGTPRRFFFSVPHDLDAVFVPTAASKKSRAHVGG